MVFEYNGYYYSEPYGCGTCYGSSRSVAESKEREKWGSNKKEGESKSSVFFSSVVFFIVGIILIKNDILPVLGWIFVVLIVLPIIMRIVAFILKLKAIKNQAYQETIEKKYQDMLKAFNSDNYSEALNLAREIHGLNPDVDYVFGLCYAQGLGCEKDPHEAVKYLEKAAPYISDAKALHGYILYFDIGAKQAGLQILKEMAAENIPFGCARYAEVLLNEEGSDIHEIVDNFKKASEGNVYLADYFLGKIFYEGIGGMDVDKEKGLLYIKKAADKGFPDAIEYLKNL